MTTTAAPTPEAAQLLADAAAFDQAAAPPQLDAQGQPVAPTDYPAEAAMLLKAAVGIAAPFWPSVPKIWTDPKQAAVAAALEPVMEKYGFTFGDFMGQYKAEITLCVVAGPIVLETIDGIKADRAAAKNPKPAAPAAPADPGTPAEIFQADEHPQAWLSKPATAG